MATPAVEKNILAPDITATRQSIQLLEQHLSRLRELAPERPEAASESVWSEIASAMAEFFAAIGERMTGDGSDDSASSDDSAGSAATPQGALSAAMLPFSERFGTGGDAGAIPTWEETRTVIDGMNAELERLHSELLSMQDKLPADGDADVSESDSGKPIVADIDDPTNPSSGTIAVADVALDVEALHADELTDRVSDADGPQLHVLDDDFLVPVIPATIGPDAPLPDYEPITPDPAQNDSSFEPGKAVDIGELDGAVYDVGEILASGKTAADLRRYSVPAGALKAAGVSAAEALAGGYTVSDLKEGEYRVDELHGIVSAGAMRDAGFRADEMHGVYSASECADAYSVQELADAGFSLHELHGIVPLTSLRACFPLHELHDFFSAVELQGAGCSASELTHAGFDWADLASAGFDFQQLSAAGAPEHALRALFPTEFHDEDSRTSRSSSSEGDDDVF